MLEPEFYTKWNSPILLKIENGMFICNSIFKNETLLFESVSGRLNNIYTDYRHFKSGAFKYWNIELIDNDNNNIYILCFPYTSAMFQSIILRLAEAETYSNIKITPYRDNNKFSYQRNKHSKVKVYVNDIEIGLKKVQLPKIECYKLGIHIRKDYTKRIDAIKLVISNILTRIANTSTQARKQSI